MEHVDTSRRVIHVGRYEYPYTADSFVNVGSFDPSNSRMNRAWVIHNAGYVSAIVFAEYYAYCEQDALDEAADRGKLDFLQVTESELDDYQTGVDSEGYPEYEGIIRLGNASEPFDQENLGLFEVPADIFKLDPVVFAVVEENSRNEAQENLQDLANKLIEDDSVTPEGYDQVWRVIDYLRS